MDGEGLLPDTLYVFPFVHSVTDSVKSMSAARTVMVANIHKSSIVTARN